MFLNRYSFVLAVLYVLILALPVFCATENLFEEYCCDSSSSSSDPLTDKGLKPKSVRRRDTLYAKSYDNSGSNFASFAEARRHSRTASVDVIPGSLPAKIFNYEYNNNNNEADHDTFKQEKTVDAPPFSEDEIESDFEESKAEKSVSENSSDMPGFVDSDGADLSGAKSFDEIPEFGNPNAGHMNVVTHQPQHQRHRRVSVSNGNNPSIITSDASKKNSKSSSKDQKGTLKPPAEEAVIPEIIITEETAVEQKVDSPSQQINHELETKPEILLPEIQSVAPKDSTLKDGKTGRNHKSVFQKLISSPGGVFGLAFAGFTFSLVGSYGVYVAVTSYYSKVAVIGV